MPQLKTYNEMDLVAYMIELLLQLLIFDGTWQKVQ